MATIPMGNFGQSVAQPQRAPRAVPNTAASEAIGRLAQTVQGVALDQVAAQTRLDEKERADKEKADALDAAMSFETSARMKSADLADRVRSGLIPPEDAHAIWNDEVATMRESTVGRLGMSDAGRAARRHAEQLNMGALLQLQAAGRDAQQASAAAKADATLDSLGKLAVLPGEDVEKQIARADQLYPFMAQTAGINPAAASKRLQDWKDRTRFDRARLDLESVRRDGAGIEAFLKRLDEGGDLAGRLDPERRVSLVQAAEGARWQLQQAAEHAADKREKAAERAIGAVTRQIESAVPLSAQAWEDLRSAVQGTSFASQFNALVTQERETQNVLRQPIDKQEQYLQEREAALADKGGTLVDRANLQRIRSALEANKKQLEEAPLLAVQRLTGRAVQPVDLQDLLQPGGVHRAAQLFADRTTTLQAMAKQFGGRVGRQPLLPQEQQTLVAVLNRAAPSESVQLFGALRAAIDDDDSYKAVMQQIAPDSPVRARAGILAASGKTVMLERNLVSDDLRVSSARVAETMLVGEGILNKTRAQKGEDGQARSLFAPSRDAFAATFADAVGDLYRGRPGAQEGDLQAAYAWYVGRAAELGRTASTPSDVDAKLAKQAVTATMGAVVNFNGQGHVRAPLGMSADDFQIKVREQFNAEAKDRGLPPAQAAMFDHYGLVNYRRDGQFVLTLGGLPVIDPKRGTPLVLDLEPRPFSGSRYRSNTDLIPKGKP